MDSLNSDIREYTLLLKEGKIRNAYTGILAFMSVLKTCLEKNYPDYATGALYFGYMDMTYFAFTPFNIRDKKLKIAVVYLHEENRFEAWLGGTNRKIQAEYIALLSRKNIGKYRLSQVLPGVDSIIESILVEQPDFDHPEELKKTIEKKILEFIHDIHALLK
jgi:hypothetical protein